MSVRIMTAVWSIRLPDSEKLVLLALADCANDEGLCWPSMATLAAKCSKSDRTIQAAIKSLVAAGHLGRQEIAGKGCRYIVHPTPEEASPPKPLRPAESSPPKPTTPTPEAASDKPSRTITSPDASHPSTGGRALRGHRLPEGWKPERLDRSTVAGQIMARRGTDWAQRSFESFENYWRSAPGKQGLRADWQRTWANWVIEQDNRDGRNGNERSRGGSRSGLGSTIDAALAFVEDCRSD